MEDKNSTKDGNYVQYINKRRNMKESRHVDMSVKSYTRNNVELLILLKLSVQ